MGEREERGDKKGSARAAVKQIKQRKMQTTCERTPV